MKRNHATAAVLLGLAVLISGCGDSGPEQILPTPSAIPESQIPSPEPLPTDTVVLPTATNPPDPSPTPTPKPTLPTDLALLSYRTLGEVEELGSISMPDVIDLEFSPDGRYLRLRVPAGEDSYQDIFYDLQERAEVFRLEGRQRVYFRPESESIAALDGNTLTTITLPGGEQQVEFTTTNQAAALSPDGSQLVEIEVHDEDPVSTTLRLIDLQSGTEIFWVFVNAEVQRDQLVFDEDGKYLAVSYFVPPGTYVATVWNAQTGRVMFTKYGYTEVDLHPYASEIALSSARRSSISLFSTVTWEQKLYLGSDQDEPGYYNLAYTSGGRLIYALSDRETTTASFWFPPSGELIELDLGLDLLAVTISPDRRYLATSDTSGEVIIWGVLD